MNLVFPFAALLLAAAGIAPAVAGQASASEVQVVDEAIGEGEEIRAGWFAIMHFTGWLYDAEAAGHKGRQFASSRERGKPTTFVYGYQRALIGLEKGMRGMKVGGRRTIVVPARLGYDDIKYPTPKDVPPKSALVFEVELLDVVPQHNTN